MTRSAELDLLAEAATDFFSRNCPTEIALQDDAPELAQRFAQAGLVEGADLEAVCTVAAVAARYAAPLPIAEDWLAQQPQADQRRLGAALRAAQMAGALERVLQLTVEHARTRVQFGQPLVRFQAVGQQLAVLAAEVAAARAAADAAAADPVGWKVAAAKIRAGEAAGRGTDIAHQVLGAIGFTDEHPLHLFTRLLWRWRDEFGTEAEWAEVLGRDVAGTDPWPLVTETSDA